MKQALHNVFSGIGLWLAACAFAEATTEITVVERVVVSSPVVKLGDISKIVSADRARGRQLAGRLLLPAPAPGTQRFLRQREIQDLLAAQGEDLDELRFSGASQVALVTARAEPAPADDADDARARGRGVDTRALMLHGRTTRPQFEPNKSPEQDALAQHAADALREQIRQTIVDYLTTKEDNRGAWRVMCNVAQRHLAQLEMATAAPKCYGGVAPWVGKQRFLISFPTPDGMVQAPVYAEVALAAQVVVTVRPIERGATITAADVALQAVEVVTSATDRHATVDAVEKVVGMEARQAMNVGEIVYIDQVQQPILVRRGDVIAVVSRGRGIRVRTSARARRDGAMGELLQVETLDTKEPFDVRVTGAREAEVFAGVVSAIERSRSRRSDVARRP